MGGLGPGPPGTPLNPALILREDRLRGVIILYLLCSPVRPSVSFVCTPARPSVACLK